MNDDDSTWWDDWQDRHPRVDRFITWWHRRVWWHVRHPRWSYENWTEPRRWKPGEFYLDHGSEPCVLIRVYNSDTLEGVSLVDGRVIGGCSIFHCGPEHTTRKQAFELAETLKAKKT